MDKKTKTQLGVTGILVVFLIGLIINAVKNPVPKSKVLKKETSSSDVLDKNEDQGSVLATNIPNSDNKFSGDMLYKKLLEANKDVSFKRDPFFGIVKIKGQASLVRRQRSAPPADSGLTAILWNNDQSLAVINHKIVKKGDKTAKGIVVEIKEDVVIINDGTKDIELRLKRLTNGV